MHDKVEAMKKLRAALIERRVDDDIVDLLLLINSIKGVHTTSSCSGRIGIMETPEIGAKPKARWLLKEHRTITYEEVLKSLKNVREGLILFKVQSPIFHVVCENLKIARRVHYYGMESGFKYTNYRALSDSGRILVEINGTENISVPLGIDGKLLVDEEYIRFLVDVGNQVLMRGKRKLERLRESFKRLKSELGDDPNFSRYDLKSY